jgi:hypothetical protein
MTRIWEGVKACWRFLELGRLALVWLIGSLHAGRFWDVDEVLDAIFGWLG